jgi:glycosyltransferase involved in cell wall biosynthesis
MTLHSTEISSRGFWLTDSDKGHHFDEQLAHQLNILFRGFTVLDLGCGSGTYSKNFMDREIPAECFDGNPNTADITNGLCKSADLTIPQQFTQADWVLSLEVGEHIPPQYEDVFIQNIITHAKKGIVLSWGIPGQPGDGHINCRTNSYVISQLSKHGYSFDKVMTLKLRESAEIWWFKNTIMVFRKIEIPKITFCIPSKNNLRYLKGCINSIKKNSTTTPNILVYVDADDDGTTNWLTENNIAFLQNTSNIPRGIAYGYNRCIEAATTEVVCMFHADMYMATGFDSAILNYIQEGIVVTGTRIEPPLHPEGKEKIVKNFGLYPEDFMETEFLSFVNEQTKLNNGKITRGIFAPWAIYKSDIMRIGLHDENLHSYHEDSDIFNRFVLSGMTLVQSWEAYVYHLTCRGGQFQDGVEKITTDENFHYMKNRSMREFIRKWGQFIQNDEYHYPLIQPRYKKTLKLINPTYNILYMLEPWFDFVSTTPDISLSYANTEQPNTIRNLTQAINERGGNIEVMIDGNTFTQADFHLIQNIGHMLADIDKSEVGTYTVGNLTVHIHSLDIT